MKRLSLAGRIQARVISPGTSINRKHLIAVSVVALQVDSHQFVSRDLTKRREGVIRLSIAGQASVFPFSGDGVADVPTDNQLAFLGPFPGPLPVSIQVVESDKRVREALGKGADLAAAAAKVFGTAGVDIAEYGAEAVGAFFAVLARLADDDDEAVGFTVIEGATGHDAMIELVMGGTAEKSLARLVLKIENFGLRDTHSMVGVRIVQPWFEWSKKKMYTRRKRATGKGYKRLSYDVPDWLRTKKSMNQWVFSAASGRHRAGLVLPFKSLASVAHWERNEVFRVSSVKAMDRSVIPLALTFSLQADYAGLEPVVDLIRAGAQFAGELEPEMKHTGRIIEKTGRSYGDLVIQLSPAALDLFQFDGAVCLLPEGVSASGQGVKNGQIQLSSVRSGLWRASLSQPIRGWGKDLGRFGFDLEVGAV